MAWLLPEYPEDDARTRRSRPDALAARCGDGRPGQRPLAGRAGRAGVLQDDVPGVPDGGPEGAGAGGHRGACDGGRRGSAGEDRLLHRQLWPEGPDADRAEPLRGLRRLWSRERALARARRRRRHDPRRRRVLGPRGLEQPRRSRRRSPRLGRERRPPAVPPRLRQPQRTLTRSGQYAVLGRPPGIASSFALQRRRRRPGGRPSSGASPDRAPAQLLQLCVSGLALVEALLEGVPGEGGALDAHRELHDTLEGLEVAEPHALELGGQVRAVALALELRLVDGHERLERADQLASLVDWLAFDRRAHHRRRGLADRAALTADLDVAHDAGTGIDVEVDDHLVAAQRVEPLGLLRRRRTSRPWPAIRRARRRRTRRCRRTAKRVSWPARPARASRAWRSGATPARTRRPRRAPGRRRGRGCGRTRTRSRRRAARRPGGRGYGAGLRSARPAHAARTR